MTLKDLAELSGVSVSTVSKAFADSNEISREKRNEIFALAKKNGCFEKYYKGKFGKKIIAVICPEICSAFYTDFITKLNDSIEKKGGMMTLSVTNFDVVREGELIQYYASFGHADGIILLNGGKSLKQEPNIPVISISSAVQQNFIDQLHTDLGAGLEEAVAYLKEMGHRNIGFLWETRTKGKFSLFCNAMRKNGLPIYDAFCVCSNLRFESAGYDAMKKLTERAERPTAVVAAYDYMALGALRYAQENNIRIPQDLSMIGMDNISATAYLDVSLTTITSLDTELCDVAADLIWRKIDNRYYTIKQEIILKSKLIKRESVAKLEG